MRFRDCVHVGGSGGTDGLAVDVPVVCRGRVVACEDAASTCASEDDYYISLSLITFCVFFLVGDERGLLHLGWLCLLYTSDAADE